MSMQLGYSYSYFFDISQQLANRIEEHRKPANVALHILAGPILNWSVIVLLHQFLPDWLLWILVFMKICVCVIQDWSFGMIYSLIWCFAVYQQIYIYEVTVRTAFLLLALASFLQLGIGHYIIEERLPEEFYGISRGTGFMFKFCDGLNEVFPAPFHFLLVFIVHCGLRPKLKQKAYQELEKMEKRKKEVLGNNFRN